MDGRTGGRNKVSVNKVNVKVNVNKVNDKVNDIYSIHTHYKGGGRWIAYQHLPPAPHISMLCGIECSGRDLKRTILVKDTFDRMPHQH